MFKHSPFPQFLLLISLVIYSANLQAAAKSHQASNAKHTTKTKKSDTIVKNTSFRSPLGIITFNIMFNYPDKSGVDDIAIATLTRFGDVKLIHNTGPIRNMTTFSIDFGRDENINFIVQIKKDDKLTQYQGTCSLKTTPQMNYGSKTFNINKFKITLPQVSHDNKPALQIEQTFPDPNAADQIQAKDIPFNHCYLDKLG